VIDSAHEAPGPVSQPARGQGRRSRSFWRELPILLAIAVVVAILVRAFVVQTFYIPSGSMEHTLDVGDRVAVNKMAYRFTSPGRGEVIVFTSPMSWRISPDETDFIKRIVAVGGDRVACCDASGRITVNGLALTEPYLDPDFGKLPASPTSFQVTVPPGRLWVMGDNRYHSGDSEERYAITHQVDASTIPVSSVVGRAWLRFWPPSRFGLMRVPATFAQVPPESHG